MAAASRKVLPVFELKGRFERAPVQELTGHRARVHCLDFNASGSHLASGAEDGAVRVWSTDVEGGGVTGSELVLLSARSSAELRGHKKDVNNVAWHPESDNQLASCGRGEKGVRLWDTRGKGKETAQISPRASAGTHDFEHLAWSPDSRYLAVVMDFDHLVTLDLRKGQAMGKPRKMRQDVDALMWAPSSQALFIGVSPPLQPGLVEVLSHPQLERLHSMNPHTGAVVALALDPLDKHMAMGSQDGLVSIWDFESLICLRTMDRLNNDASALAFSYDGRLLAVGGEDHVSIDVTETATGRQVCALPNGGSLPSLAWHPKALLLAFAADMRETGAASNIGVPDGGGGVGSFGGGGGGGGGIKGAKVRFVSVSDRV